MSEPNRIIPNGRRDRKRRPLKVSDIAQFEGSKYESRIHEEELIKANIKKRGTGKFVTYGTMARLKGMPYYIPNYMTNEGDKKSYHYGYYERGNTALSILIENGCCNIDGVVITKDLFTKYLRRIAVNDGMNPNVQFKVLPKAAKYSAIYANGYLSACDEEIRKLIAEGSTDRINAVPYDAQKYDSPQAQNAYAEGFFEHGNRELFEKLGSLTEEQLKAIGYNDYISEVDKDSLLEKIKANQAYEEGRLFALLSNPNQGASPKYR